MTMAKFSMHGSLDGWLQKRGISNPLVVPVLRNQLVFLLLILFLSSAVATETLLGIWFTAGFAVMTYILYSWAQFFSHSPLESYSSAFLRAVLLRFFLRLIILAAALYACIALAQANPMAVLAGSVAGTLAPLLTLAWEKGSKN